MNQKEAAEAYSKVYALVSDVLENEWDPIGVRSFGDYMNGMTEYGFYVGRVLSALQHGAGETEIVQLLEILAKDHMGLGCELEVNFRVAARCVQIWREHGWGGAS